MPFTEADLRSLLTERSADVPAKTDALVERAERRGRHAARLRYASVASVTVAVMLSGVAAVGLLNHADRPATTAVASAKPQSSRTVSRLSACTSTLDAASTQADLLTDHRWLASAASTCGDNGNLAALRASAECLPLAHRKELRSGLTDALNNAPNNRAQQTLRQLLHLTQCSGG